MVNSTHWTMIAKCTGCTSYQGNDGEQAVISGTGIVQFAWAQGTSAVTTPPNNASAFNVHQAFGKWSHDLNAARSPNFNTWVSSNLNLSITKSDLPLQIFLPYDLHSRSNRSSKCPSCGVDIFGVQFVGCHQNQANV
jgi:hypothetical protein